MRTTLFLIFVVLLLCGFVACIGTNSQREAVYFGNFKEAQYPFLESFRHVKDREYYHKLPYELKFMGIRPFPFDSAGAKEYSWLRNPENLAIAFNSIKLIGLDKFVSVSQYHKKNSDWCCNTLWLDRSLNEIVRGFLMSDTLSDHDDYYYKFWQRRRKENNLRQTWQILREIDAYYNDQPSPNEQSRVIDTTLYNLLSMDQTLLATDSLTYPKVAIAYFDYLKSTGMNYSAYKLIFHNSKFHLSRNLEDSLLSSMQYDTITYDEWLKLDDNIEGWITGSLYPDPRRSYGP